MAETPKTQADLPTTQTPTADRLTPATTVLLLFAVILAGLTAVTGLCDPDTWWVIADGNRILAGDFAHTNGYSHAFGAHVWNQIEWLSSVVIALFVKVVGLDNLTLLPVLVSIAITLVLADTTRRINGKISPLIFLCLLVCLLASLRIRMTARAELFSLLLTPVLLNLWVRRSPRFVWLCGGLGVIWGNLHPGVMYGLGILCLMTGASLLERDKEAAKQAATAVVAFFVGSLCNPFGALNYWHVLDTLFFVQTQQLKIDEMRAVVLGEHPTLVAAFVFAVLGLFPAFRRRQMLYLLILLIFFPLALKVKRFAPYPLLLLLPFLHQYAQDANDRLAARVGWSPLRLMVPILALVGCTLVAIREVKIWWPIQPFEWRVNTRVLPAGAADFIDRFNPPGNLFNDFNHGGYLTWRFYPQRKMYIDGRVPAYPVAAMNEYTQAAGEGTSALLTLLNKYTMDLALVYRADRVYEHGDFEPKFHQLGWELVYIEGAAYVYVRPGSAAARAITAPRFTLLTPAASPEELHQLAQVRSAELIGELVRIDPQRLLILDDFLLFGSAAYSARRPDLAHAFLAAGLERFPADNRLKYGAATALLALGRDSEARNLLQAIIARPTSAEEAARARMALQQTRSITPDHK